MWEAQDMIDGTREETEVHIIRQFNGQRFPLKR